jgi:hypothetical protein
MAAAELTPIVLNRATGVSISGQALSTGNMVDWDSSTGFYIDVGDTDQVNDASRMVIFFSNASSASTDGGIKVLSSTNNPFSGSGVPDLAVDLTTGTGVAELDTEGDDSYVTMVGPLETARFRDTDGYINVEYDTDHSGMVTIGHAWAIVLP